MDVSVAAPAEHRLLLLCQQGQDALGQLRLLGGAHQRHRGPVQALAGGFAVGAEPCPHQQLIHGIPHMGQSDAADAPDLIRRQLYVKVVGHMRYLLNLYMCFSVSQSRVRCKRTGGEVLFSQNFQYPLDLVG